MFITQERRAEIVRQNKAKVAQMENIANDGMCEMSN